MIRVYLELLELEVEVEKELEKEKELMVPGSQKLLDAQEAGECESPVALPSFPCYFPAPHPYFSSSASSSSSEPEPEPLSS